MRTSLSHPHGRFGGIETAGADSTAVAVSYGMGWLAMAGNSERERWWREGEVNVRRRRKAVWDWRHVRLVAYDISDHAKRRKLSRLLAKRGFRLQKSVFLVRVHRHSLNAFLAMIAPFRDAHDLIDVMPLCSACRNRSIRLGPAIPSAIVVIGE